MRKLMIALVATLIAQTSFAADVRPGNRDYKTVKVRAEKVNGVNLIVTETYLKDDCNDKNLGAEAITFPGATGWHDLYFVAAVSMSTVMYCPIDNPYMETIYSNPIRVESFSNENIDGEVVLDVVIPAEYDLIVEEF